VGGAINDNAKNLLNNLTADIGCFLRNELDEEKHSEDDISCCIPCTFNTYESIYWLSDQCPEDNFDVNEAPASVAAKDEFINAAGRTVDCNCLCHRHIILSVGATSTWIDVGSLWI
jgi:hypothetical protein